MLYAYPLGHRVPANLKFPEKTKDNTRSIERVVR